MLLIFHRAGADRHIGKNIGKIFIIFWIEHFIGTGHPSLFYHSHMSLADKMKPFQHIFFLFRIWLAGHSLISLACCPGLIRIYSRYDKYFVRYFFLDRSQTQGIIDQCIFIVGRAGADDQCKQIIFARQYIF